MVNVAKKRSCRIKVRSTVYAQGLCSRRASHEIVVGETSVGWTTTATHICWYFSKRNLIPAAVGPTEAATVAIEPAIPVK